MTTFIDFRYSRTLSAGWNADTTSSKKTVILGGSDSYFAIHVTELHIPKLLMAWSRAKGILIALYLRENMLCDLQIEGRTAVTIGLEEGEGAVVAVKLAENLCGLRTIEACSEHQMDLSSFVSEPLELITPGAPLLGRQAGRTSDWAKLFYHRGRPSGPGLQIVMDWHHLNSGLPLVSLAMAEQLVKGAHFNLSFRSYSVTSEDAERSDFVILFGSRKAPEITLHICPPLYTWPVPGTLNVGYFVCESSQVPPAVVERLNRMDTILTPSNYARECYCEAGVKVPIEVVPHGIDTDFFQPANTKASIPGGKKFNFVAVSSLVDRKNFRWLVKAFLQEFRSDEDVALVLCLHPEYVTTPFNVAMEYESWENRYFRDSAKVLLMTHHLKREKLRNLYANADCYVLPSNEGFGLTHLEAMSCGTPTVGLNYGGVKDFLNNENGYLVDCGRSYRSVNLDSIGYLGEKFFRPNILQLRKIMREIFNDPSGAAAKTIKARADCEAWFTWNKVGTVLSERLSDLYEKWTNRALSTTVLPSSKLSWAICVHDDQKFAGALSYVESLTEPESDLICFVSRYTRAKDVLLARRRGFLPITWDGTLNNCKTACEKICGSEWVGLIEPGERLGGDLEALKYFLDSQQRSITEVLVDVNGEMEIRFLRPGPIRKEFTAVTYEGLKILPAFI